MLKFYNTVCFSNFSHPPYRTAPHRNIFLNSRWKLALDQTSYQNKYRDFLTKNLKSANRTTPNNVPFSVLEPFFLVYRKTYMITFSILARTVPFRKKTQFFNYLVLFGSRFLSFLLKIHNIFGTVFGPELIFIVN